MAELRKMWPMACEKRAPTYMRFEFSQTAIPPLIVYAPCASSRVYDITFSSRNVPQRHGGCYWFSVNFRLSNAMLENQFPSNKGRAGGAVRLV